MVDFIRIRIYRSIYGVLHTQQNKWKNECWTETEFMKVNKTETKTVMMKRNRSSDGDRKRISKIVIVDRNRNQSSNDEQIKKQKLWLIQNLSNKWWFMNVLNSKRIAITSHFSKVVFLLNSPYLIFSHDYSLFMNKWESLLRVKQYPNFGIYERNIHK